MDEQPSAVVRRLMKEARQAALATTLAPPGLDQSPGQGRDLGDSGQPYASLVLVALDNDGSPILLLSDLADHSRNLKAEPRAALLFDGTAGLKDPLTGPRASVLGRITPVTPGADAGEATRDAPGDPPGDTTGCLRARFLARHPSAATYADFSDFHFYRMTVESAHLVAGFGRIHWLMGTDITGDPSR